MNKVKEDKSSVFDLPFRVDEYHKSKESITKKTIVTQLLKGYSRVPKEREGIFFAPANIALAKYWGKRNTEINLPMTSSLSISLGQFGAMTSISLCEEDIVFVNGEKIEKNTNFVERLSNFLDLFRPEENTYFRVETKINIPIGAGVASSASGFAAVVGALDRLYGWKLPYSVLSLLARLGSGSASRSFWQGFVEWKSGRRADGMDSYGVPLMIEWPEIRIGLLIVDNREKAISSRKAMERTVLTSPFYETWPKKQKRDFVHLKAAIQSYSFQELGEKAESNALAMHALMLTATPPILYSTPKTLEAIQKVWYYRAQGLPLYFTQDAGPNLKLLFLEKDSEVLEKIFPALLVVAPFDKKEALPS